MQLLVSFVYCLADPNGHKLRKVTKKVESDKKLKLEEQTEIQGGAAAKVGVAREEGEGKGSAGPGAGYGDGTGAYGCSKTGGDGNDEDGNRKNQSRTGPLVPADASGKNALLMTKCISKIQLLSIITRKALVSTDLCQPAHFPL